jgi:hypothetical protein
VPSDPLTAADLDDIGHASFTADDPSAVVAELVAAVDQDRIPDPEDVGYALMLAAEISERHNDLPAALELASRAVEALGAGTGQAAGRARAFRAELLARVGREEEATAEFAALRPLLLRDDDAASYLSESLEGCGRGQIAEEWLTAALDTAAEWGADGDIERVKLIYALAQVRYRVRRELDLPRDENDDMAARMREMLFSDDDPRASLLPVAMFWPRAEFDRLLLRWPALAGSYGHTWDGHRAEVERGLVQAAESGLTGLAVYAGSVDGLAAHAARSGADPVDPLVRSDYEAHLWRFAPAVPWPPGRNEVCWCGSSLKYKKCCLPRSRA